MLRPRKLDSMLLEILLTAVDSAFRTANLQWYPELEMQM